MESEIHEEGIPDTWSSPTSDNISVDQLFEQREMPPRFVDQSQTIISRFPSHIRQRTSDIRPRVVSIGPFFHGEPHLEGMEQQKNNFMLDLFRKCIDIDPLPQIRHRIREMEMAARQHYSETINADSTAFVQMLLLDSCFIIRFLICISHEIQERLISFDWSIKEIRSDLLLLENQIPYFVLLNVYEIIRSSSQTMNLPYIHSIIGPFICMDMSPARFHLSEYVDQNQFVADHLLDLYWLCYANININERFLIRQGLSLPSSSNQPNWAEITVPFDATTNIPSATELHRVAGVVFKKRLCSNQGSVARFRNGILEMPSLKIDESMKIILTNLVGFEKSLHPHERPVSSYLLLMHSLINTEEDVKLLQECGILINRLSSNLSATIFFNEIADMCTVDYRKHIYTSLFRDVDNYYNSKWNRRFASLRHNYFNNPWATIAVVAAGFLLLLNVVQTILAGFQTYYTMHPPHN